MNTDINTELFKRYSPMKKLEMIDGLTATQLFNVSPATIIRIIKETGRTMYKSRDKELTISRERRTGNSWNSSIESWLVVKGKIYIEFYLQYENTDTSTSDTFERFIRRGEFRGELTRDDRYGNPQTYYFRYDEGDKARAIRNLLYEYVYSKYATKLNNESK